MNLPCDICTLVAEVSITTTGKVTMAAIFLSSGEATFTLPSSSTWNQFWSKEVSCTYNTFYINNHRRIVIRFTKISLVFRFCRLL